MPPRGKGKAKAKSKQTHRKTTASPSSPDAAAWIFPSEVIFDILSRLPAKTLLRFKCVSKQWRKLVSVPRFISQHLSRSPASLIIHAHRTPILDEEETHPRPRLQPDGHIIYAYGPPNPQTSTIDRILDFPGSDVVGFDHLEVIGCTPNGIVCISQKPYAEKLTLWNPATRSSISLPSPGLKPNPNIHRGVSVGLGFDPSRNDYKIVRIICHELVLLMPDVVEVFSLKSGRWTLLKSHEILEFCVLGEKCDAVIDGVPYWQAVVDDRDLGERPMLASFDAKEVDFDLEPFAWIMGDREMCMGEIKGCLGAVVWEKGSNDQELDVWMKGNKSGWSKMYRVGPLTVAVKVVGFYGDRGIVVEDGGEGNLSMLNLENMATEDFFNVEDSVPGSFRVVSYRESLSRIPAMGNLIV